MAKEADDTSIEVSTSAEGVPVVKVGGITKALRWFMPHRYQKNLAFETLMHKVQAAGTFTEDEQALLAWATSDQALKLAHRQKVIEYMVEAEPEVLEVLAAPRALPPRDQDPVADQSNQYFWDRFWADAEVASVEYVQRLYGQVAARKVKTGDAVSLRTLDVLRCLEPRAAEVFSKICPYVFDADSIPSQHRFEREYREAGVRFEDLLELEEAGLIGVTEVLLHFNVIEVCGVHFKAPGTLDRTNPPGSISVMPLTRAGKDLYRLTHRKPSAEQVSVLVRHFITVAHPQSWSDKPEGPWDDVPTDLSTPVSLGDLVRLEPPAPSEGTEP